jgi:hypothetical protein
VMSNAKEMVCFKVVDEQNWDKNGPREGSLAFFLCCESQMPVVYVL